VQRRRDAVVGFHRLERDVPALLSALSDLNSFKTTNSISNVDLLSIGDSVVNNADLQSLLEKPKSGANSLPAVPEPSTLLHSIICVGATLSTFGVRTLRQAVQQYRNSSSASTPGKT
jgi:hypothetical protein